MLLSKWHDSQKIIRRAGIQSTPASVSFPLVIWDLESANTELKQLNTQLEKDLLSVGGVSELFRRGPEVSKLLKFRFYSLSQKKNKFLSIWHLLFRDNQVIAASMRPE